MSELYEYKDHNVHKNVFSVSLKWHEKNLLKTIYAVSNNQGFNTEKITLFFPALYFVA